MKIDVRTMNIFLAYILRIHVPGNKEKWLKNGHPLLNSQGAFLDHEKFIYVFITAYNH